MTRVWTSRRGTGGVTGSWGKPLLHCLRARPGPLVGVRVRRGQTFSTNLVQHGLPGTVDTPEMQTIIVESHDPEGTMRYRSLSGFRGAPASGSDIAGAHVGVGRFARDEALALEISAFLSMMALATRGDANALRGDVRLCGARDGNALEIRTRVDASVEDRLVERSW